MNRFSDEKHSERRMALYISCARILDLDLKFQIISIRIEETIFSSIFNFFHVVFRLFHLCVEKDLPAYKLEFMYL